MTPRAHYEAADRLLDLWDLTGQPRLLEAAQQHTAAAETHLVACPNAAVEVIACGGS
ncbi:hypothetical protein [Nocardiopsis sp. LOL_012]|uniref:hypothetical protein n=1 Tax=Nocardiopsis sp. LOL_012 TaxID=3345409 RepID=UPI003A87D13D